MASLNTFEQHSPARADSRARQAARSSLAKLVGQARDGDREAFDGLVQLHEEGLRSFLAHRIDAAEVDDVVQDVFVAAWKALPSYDGRSQFRTWLFAIAFNKVRDHYRHRLRRVTEVHVQSADEKTTAAGDPFASKDLSLAVRELVKTLSESQQEVILLYYQDELTLAEISGVLNRNLSTVKYQFFQAHAKLADHMKRSAEWSPFFAPRAKERRGREG